MSSPVRPVNAGATTSREHPPAPDAARGAVATGPFGSAPGKGAVGAGRLVSLDAFRGATIAAMLLVNNPGTWSAIYAPLRHAPWHGWTPTDLIFPFFLFIMGVAMTFSLAGRRARGVADRELFVGIVRRAAILIGLGLLLHGFPGYDLASIRIPGVLQRIGLAYLLTAPLVAWTGWRVQALAAAALLLVHWALLALVPVPGIGPGVLEPGMDLGAWIDRQVFGTAHLWSQSTTWDPEGLLGTLPAAGTVLTGALAGHWIRSGQAAGAMLRWLVVAGAATTALGLVWNAVLPINKPLWTGSYVLLTSGLALLTLAAFYWIVDVRGRKRLALPFTIYGMNAIAAYFLASLGAQVLDLVPVSGGDGPVPLKAWIFRNWFDPYLPTIDASLAFALCYVLFWLGIMSILYRRRIFIRV